MRSDIGDDGGEGGGEGDGEVGGDGGCVSYSGCCEDGEAGDGEVGCDGSGDGDDEVGGDEQVGGACGCVSYSGCCEDGEAGDDEVGCDGSGDCDVGGCACGCVSHSVCCEDDDAGDGEDGGDGGGDGDVGGCACGCVSHSVCCEDGDAGDGEDGDDGGGDGDVEGSACAVDSIGTRGGTNNRLPIVSGPTTGATRWIAPTSGSSSESDDDDWCFTVANLMPLGKLRSCVVMFTRDTITVRSPKIIGRRIDIRYSPKVSSGWNNKSFSCAQVQDSGMLTSVPVPTGRLIVCPRYKQPIPGGNPNPAVCCGEGPRGLDGGEGGGEGTRALPRR